MKFNNELALCLRELERANKYALKYVTDIRCLGNEIQKKNNNTHSDQKQHTMN